MVLIAGGIDLSVGATYALCQVIATKMARAVTRSSRSLVGVLVGVGVGAVNGVIATFFRINSLIATLAMSFVITGVASLVTGGNLIIAYSALGFANFARTQFLDVTTAAWTMIGVVHHPRRSCCRGRSPAATCTRPAATPRRPGWPASGCSGSS